MSLDSPSRRNRIQRCFGCQDWRFQRHSPRDLAGSAFKTDPVGHPSVGFRHSPHLRHETSDCARNRSISSIAENRPMTDWGTGRIRLKRATGRSRPTFSTRLRLSYCTPERESGSVAAHSTETTPMGSSPPALQAKRPTGRIYEGVSA